MRDIPSTTLGDHAIRLLAITDAAALAAAYSRNREHLARWDPRRDESFYTVEYQTRDIVARLRDAQAGRSIAWVIVHDDLVVGRVNLSNIVRGAFQSASIGYWVDQDHLGRGLATAGVELACTAARVVGLHRVEASTLPHNEASQRVLRRCGFEPVGRAPQYLFIAGAWQDHNLYQRILHTKLL